MNFKDINIYNFMCVIFGHRNNETKILSKYDSEKSATITEITKCRICGHETKEVYSVLNDKQFHENNKEYLKRLNEILSE